MECRVCGSGYIVAALIAGILLLLTGCQDRREQLATTLLPEARPGETNFSPYTPKLPFQEAVTNLLTRTIFETKAPAGLSIEIQDLFVLPGKLSTTSHCRERPCLRF